MDLRGAIFLIGLVCGTSVLSASPAGSRFEQPASVDSVWAPRDYRLDLGGRRAATADWSWLGWNGFAFALTNGELAVTGGEGLTRMPLT